ncbi:hypothetical protein HOF92_00340 [bacterium]|jgi:hypothetical protein|nr:hypothetical protein [bacterium]
MKSIVSTLLVSLALVITSTASDLGKQGKFEAIYGAVPLKAGQSISQLVTSLVDASDEEKFSAVNAYIQGNNLNISRFVNLIEALQVLNLQASTTDRLVALYAGKRNGKFKLETAVTLLGMISKPGFSSSDAKANHAIQVAEIFTNNSRVPFDSFKFLIRHLNSKMVNPFLRDEKVIVAYVDKNAKGMSVDETYHALGSLDGSHMSVQNAGVIVDTFIRQNAGKLTNPEFRNAVERLKLDVPQGDGLKQILALPREAQERYLYTEKKFFDSLFFTIGKVIKTWTNEVAVDHHTALAGLFVNRNQHRLKPNHIEKLRSAFQ